MANGPRPGGVAAFMQRREAYELTRSFRDTVADARAMSDGGLHKQAANKLGATLDAISQNPEAARMMEPRAAELAQARTLMRSAQQQAKAQVETVQVGQWFTRDGHMETRLSFGRSEAGHHYRLERATPSSEGGGAWSKPFASAELAERVGRAMEARAHNPGPDRPQQRATPMPRQQQTANTRTQRAALQMAR